MSLLHFFEQGRIGFSSDGVGCGCTFFFELPLYSQSAVPLEFSSLSASTTKYLSNNSKIVPEVNLDESETRSPPEPSSLSRHGSNSHVRPFDEASTDSYHHLRVIPPPFFTSKGRKGLSVSIPTVSSSSIAENTVSTNAVGMTPINLFIPDHSSPGSQTRVATTSEGLLPLKKVLIVVRGREGTMNLLYVEGHLLSPAG